MKSNFEKQRDISIRKIKKGIGELKRLNYTIEAELTETMVGTEVNHIYIRDKLSIGKIIEQKYLFSLDK